MTAGLAAIKAVTHAVSAPGGKRRCYIVTMADWQK
jgi:hypothetical protein